MGELILNNNTTLWDWWKIIKRASLHFSSGCAGYHLPYHKSNWFYQGTEILFTSQEIADPVSLFWNYVKCRDAVHRAQAALFICENSTHPTCSWFEKKFFTILDCSFGGHLPWVGSTTFYVSLGLSEDIIQALGRWSSEAWKIYIHNNPTIHAELQLWLYGFASTICDCFAVISLSSLYSTSIPHTQHQQLIIAGSCTCPSPIKMGAHGSGLWISTTQHWIMQQRSL